jgi:hypothetical protein
MLVPASLRHPLTSAQHAAYLAQGFLILPGVFRADEVAALCAEADRLLRRTDLMTPDNLRVRFKAHADTGESLFEVFDPFLDLAPVARSLVLDRRLLDPLACLYGDEPCLFKDKLIYKAPGCLGASLHQDYVAWPFFPRSFITVIIALDPFDEQSGCTEVYPGLQTLGYLSPRDGRHYQLNEEQLGGARPVPLLLEPGDVVLFGCLTPHRSGPNRSGRWRRGLFISYNARSEGGDMHDDHYRDFHAWLRAKRPPAEAAALTFR